MELRPRKHAPKQQTSHIAFKAATPVVCSTGAASFEALSRISHYLPLWVQLNFRRANTLCDSVGLDALRRLLAVPQKRGCYLIDLESLYRQYGVFIFKECGFGWGECKLVELETYILTFVDRNYNTTIDLQAFFVNCCALYGSIFRPRSKLRNIVSRICEKNSSSLERFGWLRYERHSPASVRNASENNYAVNGMFQHGEYAVDDVCDHTYLAKWLAIGRNVTTLYVPAMETPMQYDRRRYVGKRASAAAYERKVIECWKPLFIELSEENGREPAISSKLQQLCFANVYYDNQKDHTFMGLLNALGKLNTSKITHVSFLNGRLIESLLAINADDAARLAALRNSLTKIFPTAMLEFRQIVLKGSELCAGLFLSLQDYHDNAVRKVDSLNEVFNDKITSTIGRIHMSTLCLPENEADYMLKGRRNGETHFQSFCRFLTFMRQCPVMVRFHMVCREGMFSGDDDDYLDAVLDATLRNHDNGWIAVDDTMRVIISANSKSRRAAVLNNATTVCNLTFSIEQEPAEPYHEAIKTMSKFSPSLRNVLFAQAEGILADKPWTYAEISFADAYFIDQVRSRSRGGRSFRKVRLDCRHDYGHPVKLRDYS